MAIQWYPGHMHKAKKAIIERLKSVDMVIEVLDARMPASSENPLLGKLSSDKPKLKILNKQDLADPERTALSAGRIPVPSEHQRHRVGRFRPAGGTKADCRLPRPRAEPQRRGQTPARHDCGIPNVGKSTLD